MCRSSTYLHACPWVQKFTPRNTATRSTKTTIMTVHVNIIMQAAPSQRRIISISEASNQLLCFTPRNFSLSESDGGLISSSNRVHGPKTAARREAEQLRVSQSRSTEMRSINCSRDGSRTTSRFAIQVNRDGRSNCSQLASRPCLNKQCPRRGDSRRSSGQTRRSVSDGCRKGQRET